MARDHDVCGGGAGGSGAGGTAEWFGQQLWCGSLLKRWEEWLATDGRAERERVCCGFGFFFFRRQTFQSNLISIVQACVRVFFCKLFLRISNFRTEEITESALNSLLLMHDPNSKTLAFLVVQIIKIQRPCHFWQ